MLYIMKYCAFISLLLSPLLLMAQDQGNSSFLDQIGYWDEAYLLSYCIAAVSCLASVSLLGWLSIKVESKSMVAFWLLNLLSIVAYVLSGFCLVPLLYWGGQYAIYMIVFLVAIFVFFVAQFILYAKRKGQQ